MMANPHLVKQIKTESPSPFIEMSSLHHRSESFSTMDYEIDIKYEDIEEPYMEALKVPSGLSAPSRQFKTVRHHSVGGPAREDDSCASLESTFTAQCSPLQCSHCTTIFDNKEKLREHVASLHKQYFPNHNCTLCDKCFDGPDADLYMEFHMFFKHGMKTYKCTICNFISYDATEIFEHVTQYHPNKWVLTLFKMLSCITRPLCNCYIQSFSQCGKTARNVGSDSAAAVTRPETVSPTTHSSIGNTILNQPSISSNLQAKDNTGCNFPQNQTTGSQQVISPLLEKGYVNLSQNIPHCKEVPKTSHFESTVPGNTEVDMFEEKYTPKNEGPLDDSVWESSPVDKSKTRGNTTIFVPEDVAPSMNTLEEPIFTPSCSKDVLASPSPSDLNNVQRNSILEKNLGAVSNKSSSGNKIQSLKRPRENSGQDSVIQSKHLCSEASSYDSATQSEQHRSETFTWQTQDFDPNPKNPVDSSFSKSDCVVISITEKPVLFLDEPETHLEEEPPQGSDTFEGCEEKLYQCRETTTECGTDIEEHHLPAAKKRKSDVIFTPPRFEKSSSLTPILHDKQAVELEEETVAASPIHVTHSSLQSAMTKMREEMREEARLLRSELELVQTEQAAAIRNISKKLDTMAGLLNTSNSDAQALPKSASTEDELSDLMKYEGLGRHLEQLQGVTPMESTRRVLRRLMSKKLALKFSLTGLGDKRKKTKISFKDHVVSPLVLGVVMKLHPSVTRKDALDMVKRVLKGTNDWDGGRTYRKFNNLGLSGGGLNAAAGPSGGGLNAAAGPSGGGLNAAAGPSEGGVNAAAGPSEGGLNATTGPSVHLK